MEHKLYKHIGKSMNDIINEFKLKYPNDKFCYSGRLDPMAHGEVIILQNDNTKQSVKYHNKNKTYKFQVIVGLQTDTTDILGLICNNYDTNNYDIDNIIYNFMNFDKKYVQEYHLYSSITVNKKPLRWYKENNLLQEIEIPKKEVTIFDIKYLKHEEITNLYDTIIYKLNEFKKYNSNILDKNPLRINDIYNQWEKYNYNCYYNIIDFEISVSSGFYVRQFVKDVSKKIGIDLSVLDIHRTAII